MEIFFNVAHAVVIGCGVFVLALFGLIFIEAYQRHRRSWPYGFHFRGVCHTHEMLEIQTYVTMGLRDAHAKRWHDEHGSCARATGTVWNGK